MSALAIDQYIPPIYPLQLPIELWNEIAGHLSKAELVSLCRVSKVFNTISTALLYHTIFFKDADKMVMCYKTLSSNDLAARSVRSLIVIMCVFAYNNLVNMCLFEIVIVTTLLTPHHSTASYPRL
jgi:hypothetical protein